MIFPSQNLKVPREGRLKPGIATNANVLFFIYSYFDFTRYDYDYVFHFPVLPIRNIVSNLMTIHVVIRNAIIDNRAMITNVCIGFSMWVNLHD